jgi:DNA polymerase-3 subunit delta
MPVVMIRGDDEFEVDKRAREIVNSLCPAEEQPIRLETYDGRVGNVDEALALLGRIHESFNSLGFFGEERVIWIKHPVFLSENQVGKAVDVKTSVKRMAERIQDDGLEGFQVVISGDNISGRNTVVNVVKKVGKLEVFSQPKPWEVEKLVEQAFQDGVKSAGLKADRAAQSAFTQRTGQDSRSMANELDKLLLYCQDRGQVTAEDVRDMVVKTNESAVWDFTDALAALDLEAALSLLRSYQDQKEAAIKLIYYIENSVQLLLTLRACLDRGYVSFSGGGRGKVHVDWDGSGEAVEFLESLGSDPLKMNAFRVGRALSQASGLSLRLLMFWFAQVIATHEKLTSTQSPPYLLLELMVLRMLSVAKRNTRKAG